MNVSVKNLTANPLSTDVGLLSPGETKAMTMGPAAAYRAAEGLKTLSDAGKVEVTVSEETNKLDDLEPAAVGTASVADGAVTTAKFAAGALSADVDGRAVMADSFFNEATVDSKFASGAINGSKIKDGTIATAKFAAGAVDTTALAASAVTATKMDEQLARVSTDVTVSTSELLALNATPKTLVAAPGSGKALIFEGAVFFLDYNSAAYAGIAAGEDLSIKYTNGSGTAVGGCEATGFLDQTADTMRYVRPTGAASGVSDITPVANAALVLHMLSGEITTGDSPLKVRVYYRVVPTTL